MSLYVQHGHAKAARLSEALARQRADGVIFAARNEKPQNLKDCLAELRRGIQCELLFDPQFYVSTLIPPNDRYLPEYPYYEAGRTAADFIGASRIKGFVERTLGFQSQLGVDRLISPTVLMNGFTDRWSQVALTLADASIEYHAGLKDPPPLLLSFLIAEGAFDSKDELDSFLDTLTAWDVDGFYLIVARDERAYSQRFDDARLAHLLYAVHVLADRNGFRVVCGYSDFVGVLLRSVGATAFATGWSQSQRQFHVERFLKRPSGGRQARLRYSSGPLFNSIMLSELQSIHDVGAMPSVLSGVSLDEVIAKANGPEASDWNQSTSDHHHWETLAKLDRRLCGRVTDDAATIYEMLREAHGLYATLESRVVFDRFTDGSHLPEWGRAMRSFKELVGI